MCYRLLILRVLVFLIVIAIFLLCGLIVVCAFGLRWF